MPTNIFLNKSFFVLLRVLCPFKIIYNNLSLRAFLVIFSWVFLLITDLVAQSHFGSEAKKLLNIVSTSNKTFDYQIIKNNPAVYIEANSVLVRGCAMNENEIPLEIIKRLGINVRSRIGSVQTLDLPLESLLEFSKLNIPFETAHRVELLLETVRKDIGIPLNRSQSDFNVTGKGVIIGVVDKGFDFNHPTFLSSDGSRSRILKAWLQTKNNGKPPLGKNYGSEYVGQEVNEIGADTNSGYHATHVTGIAGGSGFGSNGKYEGIAPDAELVLVSTRFDDTGILDGVAYIAEYAQSVHKPCVINISLGAFFGAMDGTSFLEKGIQQISESRNGAIVVIAAGNSAQRECYIEKTFAQNTEPLQTICELYPDENYFKTSLLFWGKSNFEVQLVQLSKTGVVEQSTGWISTQRNSTFDTIMLKGIDTMKYSFTLTTAHIDNGAINASIDISLTKRYPIGIWIKAASGKVFGWNVGTAQGIRFTNQLDSLELIGYSKGNNTHTLLNPGSGMGIITVGAHTTHTHFTSLDGKGRVSGFGAVDGSIAPFSSWGPTSDGRTKPDVTAPGNIVMSAYGSYDPWVKNPDNWLVTDTFRVNNQLSYYGGEAGTSMACPVVTGMVALALEKQPNLTTAEILKLLHLYSRTDSNTGNIDKKIGSNSWGWGKADAGVLLKQIESINYSILKNVYAYPNPVNEDNADIFKIILTGWQGTTSEVEILDINGKLIWKEMVDIYKSQYSINLNISSYRAGMYFIKVKNSKKNGYFNFIKY